jgi:hypothetical protein
VFSNGMLSRRILKSRVLRYSGIEDWLLKRT